MLKVSQTSSRGAVGLSLRGTDFFYQYFIDLSKIILLALFAQKYSFLKISVHFDIDRACNLKMNWTNYTPLERKRAKLERKNPMETTRF